MAFETTPADIREVSVTELDRRASRVVAMAMRSIRVIVTKPEC